uniref:Cytochrome P450 3638G5 n=1 Tax=Maconellicoccus hirsutus TaxID=177089 RepID=A0AAT9UTP8_MACHI
MMNTMTNLFINYHLTLGNSLIAACIILIASISCYAIIHVKRSRRRMLMLKSFNQLPTLPLIGSVHLLAGNTRERVAKMLDILKTYELPLVAWLMHIPVVFIGKHSDIQTVMHQTTDKDLLGIFDRLFGGSLLVLQGEKWRRSRRVIFPAFSPAMMNQYFPVLNEYSALLTNKFESFCDTDEAFDISSCVFASNLNSTTVNMTGYELRSREKEDTDFLDAISKSLKMESMRFTFPLLFPKIIYEVYLFLSGSRKTYEVVYQLPQKIFRKNLTKYTINETYRENDQDTKTTDTRTLIDSLLKAHITSTDFTKEQVYAEILDIIIAGYETTSLTSCFVLLMLAMHPDVQEKVYDEIRTIYENKDQQVQIEDLKKLVYMEQCINETIRKFTVTPLTIRTHTEDIVLNDEQVIPAGCRIFVAFYAAHHDREFFPNADNWDPEHFAPEKSNHNRPSFFPFGAGVRSCIGAKYGMMSMKIQLVHLLRRYRLDTDMKMQDIHLVIDLLLRNDSGYWLKIYSRE